ncbi:hypothetical protein [Microbulbifer sp. VAAF005]|uniref:hypothetical protein n=1 Tax=Microbulbifer sp. VAAF005 TaxID=3034230 RepID=UPI0024AE38B4|nr:hypothetical protein [Microbulbifer sp. VAAF005]WHI46403.1 hypothetical protein P0078_22280 [Microbulbifer sp. VAAF005]
MPYKELGMLKDSGLSKDTYSGVVVPYMSEAEREKYQVTIQDGLLFWRGERLNTNPGGSWAFVMDKNGRIFCGNKNGDIQHHSAFFSGRPVAAAGHISVVGGIIEHINNFSGHYQPTSDYMEQFKEELEKNNVDLSETEMDFGISSKTCKLRLKNFQDQNYRGKWYQRFRGTVVRETVDGSEDTYTGRTHIQGQRLRLYPDGPRWQWL